MYIQDKELRELFAVESREHIQCLEAGLLRLEKEPNDRATLEEAFREAHSLKGAARMVGVVDAELIAHRIEDVLGSVRKGSSALASDIIDRICKALDAVKAITGEATGGKSASIDVASVIDSLKCEQGVANTGPADKEALTGNATAPHETAAEIAHHEGPYRIDTVRVDTGTLDSLLTHSGELTVLKTRISRRLAEATEAFDLWEEALKGGDARASDFGEQYQKLGMALNSLRGALYDDEARLALVAGELDEGIRGIRLLPLSTVFSIFPRMVRDMSRERQKEVEFVVEGGETKADKRIIEELKDPLMHLLRNSLDHGIETPAQRAAAGKPASGRIVVRAHRTETNIIIEVEDDGKGLDLEEIKRSGLKKGLLTEDEAGTLDAEKAQSVIFSPGFSTSPGVTETSGRGVGLDVVRNNIERLKGTVQIESIQSKKCLFRIRLPITLSTVRVLIAGERGRAYAIPMEFVHKSLVVDRAGFFTMEGRKTTELEGEAVSVEPLAEILELKGEPESGEGKSPCVFLSVEGQKFGVLVDELSSEQEILIKPRGGILKRVRNISGAAILGSGEVCMVLSAQDMLKTLKKKRRGQATQSARRAVRPEKRKKTVLLVEDSVTTRTQEKRILEGAGFEVVTAVDGADALLKLYASRFDIVVSDVMMPNMDGITLTKKIRDDKKYKELPVILVTSLSSDDDRRRGMEAGASAYITKPAFDQKVFLEALKRLA